MKIDEIRSLKVGDIIANSLRTSKIVAIKDKVYSIESLDGVDERTLKENSVRKYYLVKRAEEVEEKVIKEEEVEENKKEEVEEKVIKNEKETDIKYEVEVIDDTKNITIGKFDLNLKAGEDDLDIVVGNVIGNRGYVYLKHEIVDETTIKVYVMTLSEEKEESEKTTNKKTAKEKANNGFKITDLYLAIENNNLDFQVKKAYTKVVWTYTNKKGQPKTKSLANIYFNEKANNCKITIRKGAYENSEKFDLIPEERLSHKGDIMNLGLLKVIDVNEAIEWILMARDYEYMKLR